MVGLHARTMKQAVKSFYRDKSKIFHCLSALKKDQVVHILGTGTTAFHTETIKVKIEDFEIPNMADIWFAILGQKQAVPFIAVSRKKRWLSLVKLENQNDTIYNNSVGRDAIQTEAYNRIKSWKLNCLAN